MIKNLKKTKQNETKWIIIVNQISCQTCFDAKYQQIYITHTN